MNEFSLRDAIPPDWDPVLADVCSSETFEALQSFLATEYAEQTIFPPKEDIFSALSLTHFKDVRVVVLGQDPYHGEGQAHGLAFSVKDGVKIPPSLRNIFKEMESDLGLSPPDHGNLTRWSQQGVLLLNTVLTVREKSAASHAKKGWEDFTDAIVDQLNDREDPIVFVLWGGHAKKKGAAIDSEKHTVIESAHPSPLSARTGFFGSRPFSRINDALVAMGREPIDWSLD